MASPKTEANKRWRRNNPELWNAQKKRWNESQKQSLTSPRTGQSWTQAEQALVIEHKIPDRQLAEQLGRSIVSIQARRALIKKKRLASTNEYVEHL